MKTIEIKAEKQENGLWGMPMSCYKIDQAVFLSPDKQLKHSAICIALDQHYKQTPFEIFWSNPEGFIVDMKGKGFLNIKYNDFKLNGNTLTWLPSTAG